MNKQIKIFVDMDQVLANYEKAYFAAREKNPNIIYPQSQYGFFANLEPIKGALEAYKFLEKNFDVYILTAPSYKNPLCYTEKRVWVERYLGLEAARKMMMVYHKNLVHGDYLIDDTIKKNGQELFSGTLIHYRECDNNWSHIVPYFKNKYL